MEQKALDGTFQKEKQCFGERFIFGNYRASKEYLRLISRIENVSWFLATKTNLRKTTRIIGETKEMIFHLDSELCYSLELRGRPFKADNSDLCKFLGISKNLKTRNFSSFREGHV